MYQNSEVMLVSSLAVDSFYNAPVTYVGTFYLRCSQKYSDWNTPNLML